MAQNGTPHLTNSTSISNVSPFSSLESNNTAPQKAATTLKELFVSLDLTPPARGADKIAMAQIIQQVNDLLAPIDKTWDQLTALNQAKISFLVIREQHTFLLQPSSSCPHDTAKALHDSLDENSFCGKRLHAFVRKGGDVVVKNDGEFAADSPYETFLSNHSEWLDPEKAATIFNHPDSFKRVAKPMPCWSQEETSTVCSLVSIGNAIFYSQCMHNGTRPDDTAVAVGQYALNVSRFMRDEFTDEEVFANIFLRQGGHPGAMTERLLMPQNPDVEVMRNIRLFGDSVCDFFTIKNTLLEFSALIIEQFQVYPDFVEDNGQLVFHGDWIKKEKFAENENPNHALLVVGVRRTSSVEAMGGLAFLVQNLSAKKPFVIIGYDLLLSMGVKDLVAIEEGLKFDTGEWNHDTASTALIQSRSPRIFDIPDGLEADETASISRARYWQLIDPNEISHIIT